MDYLDIRKQFMNSNELYHWGIKGQKWGIRRYQNADGTLTAEGRKRYNNGVEPETLEKRTDSKGNTSYYYKDSDGKEHKYKTSSKDLSTEDTVDLLKQIKLENSLHREEVETSTRNIKNTKNALNETANVLNATVRALPTGNGKYVKKDYSSLSDQDLRNKISRLQLEESYGRLSGDTKYVKSGSEKAREVLQTAGAIVGIGGSAAALALTIAELRKNKIQNSAVENTDDYLAHYGVLGMKWGHHKYTDDTPDGKRRKKLDIGTKEILKNTSNYNALTSKQQKQYIDYSKKAGAKKGALIGFGSGAALGVTKTALKSAVKTHDGEKISVGGTIGKTIRSAILNGIGGSLIGSVIGAKSAKKKAEQVLAENGKKYVDQLLNEPISRLKSN